VTLQLLIVTLQFSILLSLFRQLHSVHSPPGSPHYAHITSSQSSQTASDGIVAH